MHGGSSPKPVPGRPVASGLEAGALGSDCGSVSADPASRASAEVRMLVAGTMVAGAHKGPPSGGSRSVTVITAVIIPPSELLHLAWRWRQTFSPFLLTEEGMM